LSCLGLIDGLLRRLRFTAEGDLGGQGSELLLQRSISAFCARRRLWREQRQRQTISMATARKSDCVFFVFL
jgi:hypothetical protein